MDSIDRKILESAVEASTDGILITDALAADNPIIYCNPSFERMSGYSAAEALGKNCRFLQHNKPRQKANDDIAEAFRDGRACNVLVRNARKDGSLFWNEVNVTPIRDSQGRVTNYLGILKDVTERVVAEKNMKNYHSEVRRLTRELTDLAQLDTLTGLYNRRYFSEIILRDWRLALREGKHLSVLIFDIDFFKRYNDLYGHQAGDSCLKTVAQAIREGLKRGTDILARYGGEEFIALLFDLTESRAQAIAATINEGIRKLNILHADSPLAPSITLSAGVASCIPHPDTNPDDLIKGADNALYQAKRDGRNRVVTQSELSGRLQPSGQSMSS
jgi:diguanylate cyclase (GGDEF)-like protein/PAS domain S-box-containing protein